MDDDDDYSSNLCMCVHVCCLYVCVNVCLYV